MSQKLNDLQVYSGKSWSGLTLDNHLGTLFEEQPTLASAMVTKALSKYDHVNMDSLLTHFGGDQELPDDRDYEWYLKGDDEKAVSVVSYTSTDTTRPGVNHSIFKITFAERYFSYTDKLIADNREYSVRVMSEPTSDGTNWVYEVQLLTGDPALFMPTSLLTAGSQFSKEYSPQEKTLSKTAGETHYSSPFKLRNSFGTLRKRDTIAANMIDRNVRIQLLDPKTNKPTFRWLNYAEWEFMAQLYKEKNRHLIYAKSNKNQTTGGYAMKGESGLEIKEFSGLREQISPAYRFNYTSFSIDWLEDVLLQLSINILPEDKRHFVALTGEWGMRQFHKALENHAVRFQPLDSKRVAGSGQNLTFQGQYREFMGVNGVRFTLVKLPEYDDRVHNRINHPDGGVTESYRYTIINFGTTNGKRNIRRVFPKGEKEKMWHIPGSCGPMGSHASFKTPSASPVDGYEIHALCKQGVILENPMSCAELVYSTT